jgi:hypothetical protein
MINELQWYTQRDLRLGSARLQDVNAMPEMLL